MDLAIALTINGLVWGLIVALIALGLSIIFGLARYHQRRPRRLLHGRHRAGLVVAGTTGFWIALVLVPLLGSALGLVIERLVIRPTINAASLTIVTTFGLSMILQEAVRATFGAQAAPHGSADRRHDSAVRASTTTSTACLPPRSPPLCIAAFFLFLSRTTLGTWIRAVRHDRETATALGIPVARVCAITFALGTALALLGGAIAAPITTVEFRTGVDILPVVLHGRGHRRPRQSQAAPLRRRVLLAVLEGIVSSFADPDHRANCFACRDERRAAGAAPWPVRRSDAMTAVLRIGRRPARRSGSHCVPILLPMFGATFWINVIAEILIWSLLAASVNLLFGYVGLLSFGQALYFGFGMYGVAIGISQFGLGLWAAFALGIGAATLMAAVAGAFAVRLTWHYFAIITVVFSLIFYFVAMSAKSITGGDDGLSFSLPPLSGSGGPVARPTATTQFYFIFLICLACYVGMALLVASPLGMRFAAVRDNENRASLIGINVYLTRWIAFVIGRVPRRGRRRAVRAVRPLRLGLLHVLSRLGRSRGLDHRRRRRHAVRAAGRNRAAHPLSRDRLRTVWENYLIAVGAARHPRRDVRAARHRWDPQSADACAARHRQSTDIGRRR